MTKYAFVLQQSEILKSDETIVLYENILVGQKSIVPKHRNLLDVMY